MMRKIVGGVALIVVCVAITSLAAHAERLVGQYRGPGDTPVTLNETVDTSIDTSGGGDSSSGSGGGGDPSAGRDDGGSGDGGDGTGDGTGDGGPDDGGGGGDDPDPNPPPSDGGTGTGDGTGGTDDSGDSSSDDGRGEDTGGSAPTAPSSGAAGVGNLSGPSATGGKGKIDASEGLRLWSFYWEHNRERLLYELLASRRDTVHLAPWGSAWVLGRGEKSLRQVHPVTQGMIAEKILPVLLRNLSGNKNDLIRDAAVIALGKIGAEESVPLLIELALKDGDNEVREDATLALGLTRRSEAYPTLLKILRGEGMPRRSHNLNQRCFAAFALGLLQHEDAAAAMMAEFKKGVRSRINENLLASMALGIGLLQQESTVKELGGYLSKPNVKKLVKAYVASALGKIGHRSALKPLNKAWKKASPMVKGSIALAMGYYPETPVVSFLDGSAMKSGEGQNKNFAAISMARIGTKLEPDSVSYKRIREMLLEKAGKPERNRTLAQYASLGLAILGEKGMTSDLREMAVAHKNEDTTRACMALTVGILNDKAAADGLIAILKTRGNPPKLRSYAALGLGFLNDTSNVPLLRKEFDSAGKRSDLKRGCVMALGIIGDAKDVDFLIEVLTTDRDATVRGASAIALGMLREATAIDKLIKVVESRGAGVSVEDKAFAVAALGYLADKDPFPYLSRIFENCNYRLEYPQLVQLLRIL